MSDDLRRPVVTSDGNLVRSQYSLAHAQAISEAGPWGQRFPEPRFHGIFRIVEQRLVGQKHLKMMLSPGEHSDVLVDAIAFNVDLEQWPNEQIANVLMVFKLDVNFFRGRANLQLLIDYLEPQS